MASDVPVFYFDLFSPYSCVAAFRLESVLPVSPVWQPVWGAPLIAASGRGLPSLEEGRERRADIVRRAARYGMSEWRWPEVYEPADAAAHARWQPLFAKSEQRQLPRDREGQPRQPGRGRCHG